MIQRRHHASGSDVYLFTGCVMDAWQRDVHHASQRVIEATGHTVTPTGLLAPCCGALHAHGGLAPEARSRATATIAALSNDDRPILVNSAGCGAAMKDTVACSEPTPRRASPVGCSISRNGSPDT